MTDPETFRVRIDDFDIDILVQGFPGKSVCHGGLGWSTIALMRGRGRVVLVDAGSFNMRRLLVEQLHRRGLTPADVTDVILTHAHYDHSINWIMFPNAAILIGEGELAWAEAQPFGHTLVPELYIRDLAASPRLRRVRDGEEVIPGMRSLAAPGHTPGHLIFHLATLQRDVIFTGDAAKNRAELVSGDTDMTYDPAISRATIDMIWKVWRMRPGSIVVPGHDLPMMLQDGNPQYLGKREAAITSWYGDDMDTTTLFELTMPAEAATQRVRIKA
jgi:N-acyl homoserine lactone hydrolase